MNFHHYYVTAKLLDRVLLMLHTIRDDALHAESIDEVTPETLRRARLSLDLIVASRDQLTEAFTSLEMAVGYAITQEHHAEARSAA